jgi:hypothetical protein
VRPPGPVPVSGPGLRLGPNDTTPDRGFSGGPTNGTTPDWGFWEQGTNGTTPDRVFFGGPTNDTAPGRFWRPVSYFLIKNFLLFVKRIRSGIRPVSYFLMKEIAQDMYYEHPKKRINTNTTSASSTCCLHRARGAFLKLSGAMPRYAIEPRIQQNYTGATRKYKYI